MEIFDTGVGFSPLVRGNNPGSYQELGQDRQPSGPPDDLWPSSWSDLLDFSFSGSQDGTSTPLWQYPDELGVFLGQDSADPSPSLFRPSGRGARFSSTIIAILRSWFAEHSSDPYPRPEDIEVLQIQTGLGRQQVLTWFSNTRRRQKPGLATPEASQSSMTSTEPMDPMTRWRNSPPEHEPADMFDISRAVSRASIGSDQKRGRQATTQREPGGSRNASLASSAATSDSNTSASSAISHRSHRSRRSADSFGAIVRRRRRRATPRPGARLNLPEETKAPKRVGTALVPDVHPFQCTFCTSTFKTRHNWQRHEKTFHLSLETWECSPWGPTALSALTDQLGAVVCTYCGLPDPNEMHLNSHHRSCRDRPVAERTFFRKDHLAQHLKLVHNAEYQPALMSSWKSEATAIRSRCGFCNVCLDTWAERVEHLAEHFKQGKTMAAWHGDWGFEPDVLDMVENSMPPYLIDYERYSPCPFEARVQAPFGPSSAWELIRLEVEYLSSNYVDTHGRLPSSAALHYEACRIILAADLLSSDIPERPSSWLRDLLLSSESITKAAQDLPIKSAARSRFTDLQIHGKSSIFQDCVMEAALMEAVAGEKSINPHIEDEWLQDKAIHCVRSATSKFYHTTGVFADLVVSIIGQSTDWLAPFRERAGIGPTTSPPREEQEARILDFQPDKLGLMHNTDIATDSLADLDNFHMGTFPDIVTEKSTVFLDDGNLYRQLIRNLSRYVASAISPRNPNRHVPSDDELQNQARWFMYDDDDPWNQTPADNPQWLRDFKRLVGLDVHVEAPVQPSKISDEAIQTACGG